MAQSLAQLIDEITVDAYDTDEQLSGFLQVFQDEIVTPASATVRGMAVEVIGFDQEGDERRGLVARCRHRGAAGTVALADVHFEPDRSPDGSTPPIGPGSVSAYSPPAGRRTGPGPSNEQASRRPTPALDRLTTGERGELLGELLAAHPELTAEAERLALARRAALGLHDAVRQIALGLLRGLANCREGIEGGTVLACAGPDVTNDLAWSVRDTLAKADLDLPDDILEDLSPDRNEP